jgi:hypothetical protein
MADKGDTPEEGTFADAMMHYAGLSCVELENAIIPDLSLLGMPTSRPECDLQNVEIIFGRSPEGKGEDGNVATGVVHT